MPTNSTEIAALIERLRNPWHHGDCKRAADELERLIRAADDLAQQLWNERRQHEMTRGDLVRTQLVRDDALREADKLRDELDALKWERDALARARDHLTDQAKLAPMPATAPHTASPQEVLQRLAELCGLHRIGFGYTNYDDGTHITVDGEEVFVGFLDENAAEQLRQAAESNARAGQ